MGRSQSCIAWYREFELTAMRQATVLLVDLISHCRRNADAVAKLPGATDMLARFLPAVGEVRCPPVITTCHGTAGQCNFVIVGEY